MCLLDLYVYRQSHQESKGYVGHVEVTNSMTTATALIGDKQQIGLLTRRKKTD
jgi:hypothetical protein